MPRRPSRRPAGSGPQDYDQGQGSQYQNRESRRHGNRYQGHRRNQRHESSPDAPHNGQYQHYGQQEYIPIPRAQAGPQGRKASKKWQRRQRRPGPPFNSIPVDYQVQTGPPAPNIHSRRSAPGGRAARVPWRDQQPAPGPVMMSATWQPTDKSFSIQTSPTQSSEELSPPPSASVPNCEPRSLEELVAAYLDRCSGQYMDTDGDSIMCDCRGEWTPCQERLIHELLQALLNQDRCCGLFVAEANLREMRVLR